MSTDFACPRAANIAAWPAVFPRPSGADSGRRTLQTGADPIRDAERQLIAVDAAASSTLFVIGLGCGYLAGLGRGRRL
jgi:hypothetical protein